MAKNNFRKNSHSKNVFCLEGLWDKDLKRESSVEPVLKLLCTQRSDLRYIHRDCATVSELKFYLGKWLQAGYSSYPILYLAFHGEENTLVLEDGKLSLDGVADILAGKCQNRIIVFGSCSTLRIDKRHINRFVKVTGCLGVCGYKTDVDWVDSTVFELYMLSAMQDSEFSGRGIASIYKRLNEVSRRFNELDFRMVLPERPAKPVGEKQISEEPEEALA